MVCLGVKGMSGGYGTVLKVDFLMLAAVMRDEGPICDEVEQTRDMGLASCHVQESSRTVRRTVGALLCLGSGGKGWKS